MSRSFFYCLISVVELQYHKLFCFKEKLKNKNNNANIKDLNIYLFIDIFERS